MVVMGTRPEVIKLAPVIKSLKKDPFFDVSVCATAQHRHMLDQMMGVFELKADVDFDLMTDGQDLTDINCRVLQAWRDYFKHSKPDLIIVQGDTTTAFATATAAFYHHIPVAHVEAGLRTGNIYSPWPEEMNRRLTGAITQFHFAPTELSRDHLLKENISSSNIWVTGNTVIDALLSIVEKINHDEVLQAKLKNSFEAIDFSKRVLLVTGHRRENFGEGFENICRALHDLSFEENVEIVYPMHLNPNVRQPVNSILGGRDNIHLIEPLDYVSFVFLMMHCHLVLTDSGGVQEEMPSLGKPVIVMRDTTERPEAITAGTAVLAGTSSENILRLAKTLLNDEKVYQRMSQAKNPFGDGHASDRISEILKRYYEKEVSAGSFMGHESQRI
ncbi:MAG: non-hydrolyzing UDP-N-acetylglucosamine 2-epimerase [Gammaproteobacteria bacterium]